MLVGEVMSRYVATAKVDTTIKDLAALLIEKKVSGVPVVNDKGVVVGVVSESDLLHRRETGTERSQSWWTSLLKSDSDLANEFVRYRATKVGDIMNREVISISEDAKLQKAAELLARNNIRRIIVLRGEKLAGIVTRSDIVRALARHKPNFSIPAKGNPDDAIRQRLADNMAAEPWAKTPYVSTLVHDGVVELSGFVNSESQKKALKVLAEGIPGVHKVRNRVQVFMPSVAMVS